MNERDKTAHMMQASAGNSWGTEAHFQAFANLIRADAMEAATRAANESWTLACKKMVEFEREACAKVCESHVRHPSRLHFAEAIRARGNT